MGIFFSYIKPNSFSILIISGLQAVLSLEAKATTETEEKSTSIPTRYGTKHPWGKEREREKRKWEGGRRGGVLSTIVMQLVSQPTGCVPRVTTRYRFHCISRPPLYNSQLGCVPRVTTIYRFHCMSRPPLYTQPIGCVPRVTCQQTDQ